MAGPQERISKGVPLPSDTKEVGTRRYYIESFEQGDVVAKDGKVVASDWLGFHTGALDRNLIQQISHLQLITVSKDKAIAKDPREGNWCWFELGIVRGKPRDSATKSSATKEEEESLCWMSHENAFMTEEFEWREGKVFSRGHALLTSLKDGDRIQVRLCARFEDWGISATKGYLVFDIGYNAGDPRLPVLLSRDAVQDAVKPQILIARADGKTKDNRDPVENVLEDCDGRLKIKCVSLPSEEASENDNLSPIARLANKMQTTREHQPSLLIGKVSSARGGTALDLPNIESEFPPRRILVVLDATAPSHQSNMDGGEIENKTGLSWDQTVENFWKLGVDRLRHPYHLLVRFGHEGVIYRDPAHPNDLVLIFEPGSCEGCFSDEKLEAHLDTVFMAGLASCLAKESHLSILHLCETQIKQAVITGLEWCRRFKHFHDAAVNDQPAWGKLILGTTTDPVFIPVRLSRPNPEQCCSSSLIFRTLPYDPSSTEAATEIALTPISEEGKDDLLPYVPTASFGDLVTADRCEIDSFRNVAHKLKGYLSKRDFKKPFSIAVFGRPGSGKSFGIKEVIQSIFEGAKTKYGPLEWNLSQFEEQRHLDNAFKKIWEKSKDGVPVVYFDEFDATHNKEPLYWVEKLEGFLKEDKKGQHGIYVFIGGTAETFEEFQLQPSRRAEPPPHLVTLNEYPASCEDLKTVIERNFSQKQMSKILRFQPAPSTTYEAPETESEELMNAFRWVKNLPASDADSRKTQTDPLEGKSANDLPIVFFDNFGETRQGNPLGWLKYFLAPMQDGEFFDNRDENVHELGHAIFVFIEGNLGLFESFLDNPDMPDVFKHAKGPDFVSRLSGQFVNNSTITRDEEAAAAKPEHLEQVLKGYKKGLKVYEKKFAEYTCSDEYKIYEEDDKKWKEDQTGEQPKKPKPPKQPKPLSIGVFRTDDTTRKRFAKRLSAHIDIQGPNKVHDDDDMFVIRRAIMLRHMLKKRGLQGKFQPGSDVLRALLRVPRLRHGARSLETILAMSCVPGDIPAEGKEPEYFQREHLPQDSQLKLHVDLKSWKKYLDLPAPTKQSCSEIQNKGGDGDTGLDDAHRRRRGDIQWIVLRRGGGYNRESLS